MHRSFPPFLILILSPLAAININVNININMTIIFCAFDLCTDSVNNNISKCSYPNGHVSGACYMLLCHEVVVPAKAKARCAQITTRCCDESIVHRSQHHTVSVSSRVFSRVCGYTFGLGRSVLQFYVEIEIYDMYETRRGLSEPTQHVTFVALGYFPANLT